MIPVVDKSFAVNHLFLTVASASGNNSASGKSSKKLEEVKVLVTFDDGPWCNNTPDILKFLDSPQAKLKDPGLPKEFIFNRQNPPIKAAFFLIANRSFIPSEKPGVPMEEAPEWYGGYLWSPSEKKVVGDEIRNGHIVGVHRQASLDGYDFTPWDNLNPDQQNAKALNNLTEKDPAKLTDSDGDDTARIGITFEENGKVTNWLISDVKRGKEMIKEVDDLYIVKYYRPMGMTCDQKCHDDAYEKCSVRCIRGTSGEKGFIDFNGKLAIQKIEENATKDFNDYYIERKSKPTAIMVVMHDKKLNSNQVAAGLRGVNKGLYQANLMPVYIESTNGMDKALFDNPCWRYLGVKPQ